MSWLFLPSSFRVLMLTLCVVAHYMQLLHAQPNLGGNQHPLVSAQRVYFGVVAVLLRHLLFGKGFSRGEATDPC
jgi:hypothetical protein